MTTSPPRPPITNAPPAQDTARYEAWMKQRGKPIGDQPREAMNLRLGDWGFFDHGGGPGQALDRAGLDRSNHVVQPQPAGDWHAFLSAPGVDAAAALARVAWLFAASELDVERAKDLPNGKKVTDPTLKTTGDKITLQGWLVYPPNMSAPMRITITATPSGATFVNESAKKL